MSFCILLLGWVAFAVLAGGVVGFVLTSLHERRTRAVKVAVVVFTPSLAGWAALLLVDFPGRAWILLALLLCGGAGGLLLTLPFGVSPRLRVPGPQERLDERKAIFHRFHRLAPRPAGVRSVLPRSSRIGRDRPPDPRVAAAGQPRHAKLLPGGFAIRRRDVRCHRAHHARYRLVAAAARGRPGAGVAGRTHASTEGLRALPRRGPRRRDAAQPGPCLQPHRTLARHVGRAGHAGSLARPRDRR